MADSAPLSTRLVPPTSQEVPLSDIEVPSAVEATSLQQETPAESGSTLVRDYGRYRLVRDFARGGLGVVSLAEDPKLGRTVALKEIRPDHPSPASAVHRFLNEAAITGRLEHPGIVPVYTLDQHPDGQPFYAMRFIQGRTFTQAILDYHDHPAPLVFRELLQRFVSVCQTMAYAHSKDVIHRDLKPDNIMLGAFGETLVLDWGLAKEMKDEECRMMNESTPTAAEENPHAAIDHPQFETQQGQVVGTPAYMAPEQAMADQQRIGPLSDVYALGALLYSLLTGKAPFTGNSHQVLHQLHRGEQPVPVRSIKPDTPLSLIALCGKAMARQPRDRYPDAAAMARDLERWLADEPVTAYPEPWFVRCQRWLRRHKTLAAMVAVGLFLLLAASLVLVGVVQEFTSRNLELSRTSEAALRRERDQTEQERRKAEEALAAAQSINAFLREEVLRPARPRGWEGGLGRDLTLRQTLDAAVPRLGTHFAGQPLLEADLLQEIGYSYYLLGVADRAEPLLRRAVDLCQKHLGQEHEKTLTSQNYLAMAWLAQGRLAEAQALFDVTEARVQRQFGPDHAVAHSLLNNRGSAMFHRGEYVAAEQQFRRLVERRKRLHGDDHADTLTAMGNLAATLMEQGRYAEAEQLQTRVCDGLGKQLETDHPNTLENQASLAILYQKRGRYEEAEKLLRRVVQSQQRILGLDHPQGLENQASLGNLLTSRGRWKEAEQILRDALKAQERLLGADHPQVNTTRSCLAGLLGESERHVEAEALLRDAWQRQQQRLGPEHPDTLTTAQNLASMLYRKGHASEADQLNRQVLETRRRTLGPEHPHTLATLHNQATDLCTEQKFQEGEALLRQVWQSRLRVLGPDHPDTLRTQGNLACTLRDMHRHAEAEPLFKDAIAREEAQWQSDHPTLLRLQGQYGVFLCELERWPEAEVLLRRLLPVQRRVLGPENADSISCQTFLALLCQHTNRLEEAEALARPLLPAALRTHGPNHPHSWAMHVNLARILRLRGKHAEAVQHYRLGWENYRRLYGPAHEETLDVQVRLAQVLTSTQKHAEAEPLLLERYQLLAQQNTPADRLRKVAANIASFYDAWDRPEQAKRWRERAK